MTRQHTRSPPFAGTITVDAGAPGARIPSGLYGVFFEEISHAGDGGLYAELIRNRGFEDARIPPGCTLESGFIVPPRTPHFDTGHPADWRLRWDEISEIPAWSLEPRNGATADMTLVNVRPLTPASPHSLQIDLAASGRDGRVALINSGYWGIRVTRDASYRLSVYLRSDGSYHGTVSAAIEDDDGKVLAFAKVTSDVSPAWKRFDATLAATSTNPGARFALILDGAGRVWVDFVSLFPAATWRGRPNGLRPDLAQLVADLTPAFIRFPGGCFVEGMTIESRPHWKTTLGPIEGREATFSPWGYWLTNGFGYHEMLQFAEDLGAEVMLVVNAGMSCSFRSGTFLADDELPGLIQDTLDAIEYAIGPDTSRWGAVRGENGHPGPFPLTCVEVGNEQQGERYARRFACFYEAIKAVYPRVRVALSSGSSGIDQMLVDAAGPIDIVDEHAYHRLHWTIEHFDSFAARKRQGWEVCVGEFATNEDVGRGNLLAMLGDAAYMMDMERNSDLVKMVSYAPLFENVNRRDWPVSLLHYDSSRSYARSSYYAIQLFATNRPDVNLATTVTGSPQVQGRPGHERVLAIAGRDETTGDIVLKVVNSAPDPAPVWIQLHGIRAVSAGTVTVLTSPDPNDENSFDTPEKVTPRTMPLPVAATAFAHVFSAYSLSVMRIPAD